MTCVGKCIVCTLDITDCTYTYDDAGATLLLLLTEHLHPVRRLKRLRDTYVSHITTSPTGWTRVYELMSAIAASYLIIVL